MNNEIIKQIETTLEKLAPLLIKHHLDLSLPYNQDFYEHPDDPKHHKPEWHQWGIITHTKMFLTYHRSESFEFFEQWGIREQVESHLSTTVDNIPKSTLLEVGILLHDIGKFTERIVAKKQLSNDPLHPNYRFLGHEDVALQRIEEEPTSSFLQEIYPFTAAQKEYIGMCGNLHFKLADIRKIGKDSHVGFTQEFLRTNICRNGYEKIKGEHPEYIYEIGIMYLGDSLGKQEFRSSTTGTPEERTHFKKLLEERCLEPRLLNAIFQLPISIEMVKHYFQAVLQD